MAKKLVFVETVKMTDIREKELLYLVVGEGSGKVIINVGQKTFDTVESLLEHTARPNVDRPTQGTQSVNPQNKEVQS